MTKPILPCTVCSKATQAECSHVDCPNRHPITAQVGDKPAQPWADEELAQGVTHG